MADDPRLPLARGLDRLGSQVLVPLLVIAMLTLVIYNAVRLGRTLLNL